MHEVFLQRLAAHPMLRQDVNFEVFLEYEGDVSQCLFIIYFQMKSLQDWNQCLRNQSYVIAVALAQVQIFQRCCPNNLHSLWEGMWQVESIESSDACWKHICLQSFVIVCLFVCLLFFFTFYMCQALQVWCKMYFKSRHSYVCVLWLQVKLLHSDNDFFVFFFAVEREGEEQEREAGWLLQSPDQVCWWDSIVRTEGIPLLLTVKWADM